MALVVAGERSGVGKTTVTLALLASLRRRGVSIQSFKVGPDYIDPMFHAYVTGRPCRNLDPVLTSEAYLKRCFVDHSQECQYSLVEGVMGLFDGVKGVTGGEKPSLSTDFASTAHITRLLDLPILLVIDCSRLSGSVAAIAHGYCSLDPRIKIAGVVLNRVGSDRHLSLLKDSLAVLQLPIVGVLRRQDNITIPDRHLGLVPTAELPKLEAVVNVLADLGDTCFDWQYLLPLLENPKGDTDGYRPSDGTSLDFKGEGGGELFPHSYGYPLKIAVARDRAFNFYYQDNLDLLQNLGAEVVFWSPLTDTQLPPDIQGMYFGGGFPEVFAEGLAANISVRNAVKTAILAGVPTIAECGGLMYLCKEIIDFEGKPWQMAGVLPTSAIMGKNLTLGYRRAVASQDNLLVSAGTSIYGHEFHRSELNPKPEQSLFKIYPYDGDGLEVEHNSQHLGTDGNIDSLCGLHLRNLHASYIHVHWGQNWEIPRRFLQRCLEISEKKK
ncbi:cobyrinate a,c-diamide synthase [Anabaenopsis sp. FSS-46]|uniref:cobyrinate a,c-diamide synthase n=1 Tax=Anabaenopsis sp. FSS-46 TaxID=2971766 RepID=UPI0024762A38|nr:cobyrinate a,c-diamide synthase [Anabaenopsis sp. FSS-46]MDH6099708.1 cobyrinate a,c-diamide synthase [Anabaenopsis sp. FSS-46]